MRAVLTLALALAPAGAHAGWWSYDDGEPDTAPTTTAIRFTPQLGVWISTFERPSRACRTDVATRAPSTIPGIGFAELGSAQIGGLGGFGAFGGCFTDGSDEVGIAAGGELTFRMSGPFHLSVGAHLLYTFPERDFTLKKQLILPVQFGFVLTWPEWVFRPILAAKLTPLLYLTDDARDFSYGGEGGFAWRIAGLGDLSFVVGRQTGDTMDGWQIQLGLTP